MTAQTDPQAGANAQPQIDTQESREWMDALSAVIDREGAEYAHKLIEDLLEHARENSVDMPFSATTGYIAPRAGISHTLRAHSQSFVPCIADACTHRCFRQHRTAGCRNSGPAAHHHKSAAGSAPGATCCPSVYPHPGCRPLTIADRYQAQCTGA